MVTANAHDPATVGHAAGVDTAGAGHGSATLKDVVAGIAADSPGFYRRALLAAVLAAWAVAAVTGTAILWAYEARPGAVAPLPSEWPAGSRLAPDPMRHVLVLTLNPRCPCSRATLRELDRLVARGRDRLGVVVIFAGPAAEGGDLWRAAADIPGLRLVVDPDGREANLFGAATSGHAALYGPNGRLRFRGGITPSRGHSGDNAGADAVLAALGVVGAGGPSAAHDAPGPAAAAPAYGCPIRPAPHPGTP